MLAVSPKCSLDTMANVRPATEYDIPRILQLYDELTINSAPMEMESGFSANEARAVFSEIQGDPRHELFVAEEEGQVVGTIVLLIVPNLSHGVAPWAIAENIIVSEEYRRKGIGRMLLEHVIARAREKGCYKIQLVSDTRRKEAHKFYGALGFEALAHGFRLYF
jgi:GNAT superfamily N-acetyltransferase